MYIYVHAGSPDTTMEGKHFRFTRPYPPMDKDRPGELGWQFTKQNLSLKHATPPTQVSNTTPITQQPRPITTPINLNNSKLLSLPQELRLIIYHYVLTDPSNPNQTVEISRQPLSPVKSSLRFPNPAIQFTISPPRNSPINTALLRVNSAIYNEALPVLYHSIRFAVVDLQGIFPLFLNSLPDANRALMRYAKLRIPASLYDVDMFPDPPVATLLFHWALTCAQVAKVEGLWDVEVEGLRGIFEGGGRLERGLLGPLARMKVKKVFCGGEAVDAERRLEAVGDRLKLQDAERRLVRGEDGDEKEDVVEGGAEEGKQIAMPSSSTSDESTPPADNTDSSLSSNPPATTIVTNVITSNNNNHQPRIYEDDPPPYTSPTDWDITSLDWDVTSFYSPTSPSPSSPLFPASPTSTDMSEGIMVSSPVSFDAFSSDGEMMWDELNSSGGGSGDAERGEGEERHGV
ncbi:unnamed protein product [Periconia digitata]|uniref:Uncharacterized protein n=1 Tax=Periconia digitata TaxID=1303443 RepID=A0A9W4U6T3_9PLEO|nr:unnamed protein product [Periconia digitata]